jgi:hypothetical protein
MPSDPYYRTPHWRRLRAAALRRDGGVWCPAAGSAPSWWTISGVGVESEVAHFVG